MARVQYLNIINQSKFKIYNIMKKGSWTQLQLDGNIVKKTKPIGISIFKGFYTKIFIETMELQKTSKVFSLIAPTLHLKNVD